MAKTGKSHPSAKPKPSSKAGATTGKERRTPRLREQVQQAYDVLRDLLGRAGYHDLLAQLEGLDTVNEVLRHRPENLPLLQRAAWELRHEKRFCELFRGLESGEVVEDKDIPIGPCGRTYAEVEQAHLYGAARLYFERLEVEFATKRARATEKKWKKALAEKKKGGLTGRLVHGLKELTSDTPRFEAESYRHEYPGYGLYQVLKPHLKHDWQFRLVPLYARLQTRQAEALDELITFFTEPADLETVVNLKPEDIAQARGIARVYAEAVLGVSRNQRQVPGEDAEALAARQAGLQGEERRVFDLLLTRHVASLDPLRAAGAGAEATVRQLAPVFEDQVFVLFQQPQALENALNCPEFAIRIIGTAARSCPPKVSQALTQIQDRNLAKDILQMAVSTFSPEELEEYLSDPKRLPIWVSLAAKFNNNYRYQADAPSDSSTLRNRENLAMVMDGIFDAMRMGRVDTPSGAD